MTYIGKIFHQAFFRNTAYFIVPHSHLAGIIFQPAHYKRGDGGFSAARFSDYGCKSPCRKFHIYILEYLSPAVI